MRLRCLIKVRFSGFGGDLDVLCCDVATVLESLELLFRRLLPVELLFEVAGDECRLSGMHSEVQHVRRVEDSAVERGVVAEHQRREVQLPIQCRVIYKRVQILLNRFVSHFSLTVCLRMIGCGFEVAGSQLLEQSFAQLGAELSASVSDDVQWYSVPADPVVEDGLRDRVGFLVFERYQLDILRECVGHA